MVILKNRILLLKVTDGYIVHCAAGVAGTNRLFPEKEAGGSMDLQNEETEPFYCAAGLYAPRLLPLCPIKTHGNILSALKHRGNP